MQSPGNESTVRKRKFEEHYECSSANSSEEIFQRVHENSRTKVSRVYIRVDPSDMSLVSSRHLLQKHKFHLCNSIWFSHGRSMLMAIFDFFPCSNATSSGSCTCRMWRMDIIGENMGKRSRETIHPQGPTSSAPLPQAALSKRRYIHIATWLATFNEDKTNYNVIMMVSISKFCTREIEFIAVTLLSIINLRYL